MSLRQSRQAGSATTFVIIAIILVAATIGSIYFVVQRGDQARKADEASKLADQQAAQNAIDAQNAKNAAAVANKPASTATNSSATAPTGSTPVSTATALPTTGAGIDIVRVLAIGLLTGTITSFVLSRRSLKSSI